MAIAEYGNAVQRRKPPERPRRRESMAVDYESLAQFRYHLRQFWAFSEQAARHAGLTSQQHQALLVLRAFSSAERLTIGELAKRLALKHHSVVGLMDRLVARNLVRRTRDVTDRRHVWIKLTPKSRTLLVQLSKTHQVELQARAPTLIALLRRLQFGKDKSGRTRLTRVAKKKAHSRHAR